ncbi:MAG TPA: ROK family protein [Myxococcota bacterium]|nr:ROK family protein [Myxococcota bacterium]
MWLGFDIGGTKLAVVVGDDAGRITARRRRPIHATGDARADVNAMIRDGNELLEEAGVARSALRGVGVATPGPIDFAHGVVESPPNLAGWGSVPIEAWLAAAFDVPVHLENDANAAALAEWRFGAGRGARHLVYLTMSTGVGGGLVLDGRLYRGTGGAGEAGHMSVEWGAEAERCGCGRHGCLEAYVGGRRWSERLARITPAASRVAALAGTPAHARPEHVIAAAREGDPFALAEVDRWNHYLARGLTALSFVLAPERFVLGTIATAAGEDLCFAPLRRELTAIASPWPVRCEIRGSGLGEEAPYCAALCAALEASA